MSKSQQRPIFVLADQLVQVWLRNAADLAELESLRESSERAHAYLHQPGCNEGLARAYLERVDQKRTEHLLRLHAGRREAVGLMARAGAELTQSGMKRHAAVSSCEDSSHPASLSHRPARKYA